MYIDSIFSNNCICVNYDIVISICLNDTITIIVKYARLSLTQIARIVGISKGSTYTILKNHLKVRLITAGQISISDI
jgi:hypothetical protein